MALHLCWNRPRESRCTSCAVSFAAIQRLPVTSPVSPLHLEMGKKKQSLSELMRALDVKVLTFCANRQEEDNYICNVNPRIRNRGLGLPGVGYAHRGGC